jgi:hypothetical protein
MEPIMQNIIPLGKGTIPTGRKNLKMKGVSKEAA